MKKVWWILIIILILLVGLKIYKNHSKTQELTGDINEKILVDGLERNYVVHIPINYDSSKNYPLVFVFHGAGGNAANAERMSNMTPLADKENFIVIYPSGTGPSVLGKVLGTWNSGTHETYAYKNNVDDVKFVKVLINETSQKYNIDKKRIYATGLSNGAMMSYRLACEMSDVFAAVAPVSGGMKETCSPKNTISIIHFHGTEDQYDPFEGGIGNKTLGENPEPYIPISDVIKFWSGVDKCNNTPSTETFGNITHYTYSQCVNGINVELYKIGGQGHSWPGGQDGLKYGNADTPTREISASELIWQFFKAHPMP